MATVRSQTQIYIPTVMGAGTPTVVAALGTVNQPGAGGTNPYFLLQKGVINNNSANAVHVALMNGSAGGTVALVMIPSNGATPFDLTVGGGRYEGEKIDNAGGLCMKYVGTSLGTAGTVSGMFRIKDVLQ